MLLQTFTLYRKAYGGLSRSTWWLSLVMLINRSGTMVVPFMTMYLTQHVGVSIGKAGLVMSLFGMGAIIGALIGGWIVDKIGYHYVQLFTLTGGGILFLVLGQMHSYLAICICTFFLAMVNEAFRPANSVAVAHYSKEENRTRSYSLNRLAINLGWSVGGATGGLIASYKYEMLFWVDGFTNIAAAIMLFIVLKPANQPAKFTKPSKDHIKGPSAYQDRNYILFISLVFLFAICFFQLFTTIPVFYKQNMGLSVFFIGLIMALNGLIISLFEMVLVFKLEGRRPNLHYIGAGVLMICISFLMLAIPGIKGLLPAMVSMLLCTVGEIFSMPFMNSYWISRTRDHNRGQYAALYTVSWASAQALGPYLCAQTAEHFGFSMLWLIMGCTCFVLGFGFWFLQKRRQAVLF